MDKRKGLIAAYRRLGPFNRFLFWLVIIGIILTVLIFVIQQMTGATKEVQETAQLDRNVKHKEQTRQISEIDEKINFQNRPYIGVEKFNIRRDNALLFPQDYLTLHLKNFGEAPANNVSIYLDILDEASIKEKIKSFSFRNIVPGNFSIMPKDTLKIDEKSLNSGVILDMEEYDKWSEESMLREIRRRKQYYQKHNKFPRQDIVYVKLEIKYRGIEKFEDMPFYLKAIYSPELKDNEIVWISSNSEVK